MSAFIPSWPWGRGNRREKDVPKEHTSVKYGESTSSASETSIHGIESTISEGSFTHFNKHKKAQRVGTNSGPSLAVIPKEQPKMQPQNTTNTKRHDNAHEQLPSYSSLQSSLRSSESKGKDMQREIETLKLLNSDLQQTIKERQQEIGNLISSKSALQQNLDSRQQEIGSLKFSKTALQKNLQVLKQENGNLKSSETDLQRHLDGLLDELDSQKLKAQTSFNVLLNESEQLKKDMKKLEALHIKSVNSVGTGLEPITDEKFIKRFRGLHDDVNEWSRRLIPKSKTRDRGQHTNMRFRSPDIRIRPAHLIEIETWGYMDSQILSVWLPGMLFSDHQRHFRAFEEYVRGGDASKTADKAEFWKAYTTSLMYQNSEYMHHTLGDSFIDWHVWRLQNHLWLVSTQNAFEIVPQADTFEKLKGFIRSVMVLAHDLQCQRGVYEFDHTVQLGDRYDESKMHDVKLTDMEDFEKDGKVAIVSCILSKGWVRKVYSGSVDIDACICKARVTVTVEDSRI